MEKTVPKRAPMAVAEGLRCHISGKLESRLRQKFDICIDLVLHHPSANNHCWSRLRRLKNDSSDEIVGV